MPTPFLRNRRHFLSTSLATLGGVAVSDVLGRFLSRAHASDSDLITEGFGPVRPVRDETTGLELLALPEGFRYLSFGWRGEPMADGQRTPGAHDGMAVIHEADGIATLCRNHEVTSAGRPIGREDQSYDSRGAGGCTNLRFNLNEGRWIDARPSLSGTVRNCAGGPTPWGTWLSCEETVLGAGDIVDDEPVGYRESHGWIFEVPPEGATEPVPLKDMGRFVHEAIAVDPETGYVYETEDRGTAGFYRFVPNEPGKLAKGGQLFMLKADGVTDTRRGMTVGKTFDVSWVPIEDPQRRHRPGEKDARGVHQQGAEQGAATFARLEGCWAGNRKIYFTATSGGDKQAGQVWQYDPREETLTLVFESPGNEILDMPDNMAVSPRGGIVLCEDGRVAPQRLQGLTPDGRLFTLAANNIQLNREVGSFRGDFRGNEWCGACFSNDGKWLFANIQTPGVTFAITGPWRDDLV